MFLLSFQVSRTEDCEPPGVSSDGPLRLGPRGLAFTPLSQAGLPSPQGNRGVGVRWRIEVVRAEVSAVGAAPRRPDTTLLQEGGGGIEGSEEGDCPPRPTRTPARTTSRTNRPAPFGSTAGTRGMAGTVPKITTTP